ncbi:MAG: hypothetical protein WAK55_21320 [Xanthobacteraceae bacterium]
MKVQFLKWGNGLALRVPKSGAGVGKAANMEVRDAGWLSRSRDSNGVGADTLWNAWLPA